MDDTIFLPTWWMPDGQKLNNYYVKFVCHKCLQEICMTTLVRSLSLLLVGSVSVSLFLVHYPRNRLWFFIFSKFIISLRIGFTLLCYYCFYVFCSTSYSSCRHVCTNCNCKTIPYHQQHYHKRLQLCNYYLLQPFCEIRI